MRISEMVKVAIGGQRTYGDAARAIGADYPKKDPRTIEQALRRWTGENPPKLFVALEKYIRSLGYDLVIVEKGSKKVL